MSRKSLTVGDLRRLIAELPDHVPVVVPCNDHGYRVPKAAVGNALFDALSKKWTEDYGEASTPEAEYGKRIQVLIIN